MVKKYLWMLCLLIALFSFYSVNAETWKYNYLPVTTSQETSTTFYPTSFNGVEGVPTSTNVTYIKYSYDDLTINVSETTNSPGIDFRINFTGISSFNNILGRWSYTGTHDIQIELWNYVTLDWDIHEIEETSDYLLVRNIYILDSADHVQNGIVQVRFYHPDNGNINHYISIDSVQLLKGTTAITINEHDALSGRDNILTNHPNIIDVFYTENEIDAFGFLTSETDPIWSSDKSNYYNKTESNNTYLKQDGSTPLIDDWRFGNKTIKGKEDLFIENFTLSGGGYNEEIGFDPNKVYTYDISTGYYTEEFNSIWLYPGSYIGYDDDYYWLYLDAGPSSDSLYKILKTDFDSRIDNWIVDGYWGDNPAPSCSYSIIDNSPVKIDGETGDATFLGEVVIGILSASAWIYDVPSYIFFNPTAEQIENYLTGSTTGLIWLPDKATLWIGTTLDTSFNASLLPTNGFKANSGTLGQYATNGVALNHGEATSECGAIGYSTCTSQAGFSGGYYSKQEFIREFTWSSNKFNEDGDSQTHQFTLNALTSSATAREMAVGYTLNQNPSGVGTGQRLIIPTNSIWTFRVSLVGIDDSDATNVFNGERIFVVHNDGGTLSVVKAETIGTDYNPDSWGGISTSVVDVSGTDIFQIKVSGKTSRTIKWTGGVWATELTDTT